MQIFMFNRKVIKLSLALFVGVAIYDLILAFQLLLLENLVIAVTGGPVVGFMLAQYRREFRGKLLWASTK